jgi:hypothetical protein
MEKEKSSTKEKTSTSLKKKFKRVNKEYYVNPVEFLDEIKEFYQSDFITDKLAIMIKNIAYGLAHAPNFINYTFREDAVGDSMIAMFEALRKKKFNADSGNSAFAYFTTIAFNCWRNRIKTEAKERNALLLFQEEVYCSIGSKIGVTDGTNPLLHEQD